MAEHACRTKPQRWRAGTRKSTMPAPPRENAMTTEMTMLCWSVVLGLLQIMIAALGSVMQHGLPWAASPRDTPTLLTGITGRLDRAAKNFNATFPFFLAVVLVGQWLDRHGSTTVLGAQIYFWARVVYVPVYAAGIPYLRTLVWAASMVGIVMLLCALF
jgi:uncharacterized MAPEG superfamily protein